MSIKLPELTAIRSFARLAVTGIAVPALVMVGAQSEGGIYTRLAGVSSSNTAGTRPADVAAMKSVVARIDSVFRRDAAIAPPPSAVMIKPFGTVGHATADTRTALLAGYSIFLLRPKQFCGKAGCRMDPGEGPSLAVKLNDPLAVMGLWGGAVRPIGREGSLATMYAGKKQVGELSGFPLYENGAVVIAKQGKELWLPVTREEFARARLEGLRAGGGTSMAQLITAMEQELATLDNKGAPAYCCHENHTHPIGVTDASTEGAYPIVRLNSSYFDPVAKPTAVQLIVIGTEQAYAMEMGVKPTEPNYVLMKAIREQLDWSALAALLH
jgi:hypothetical protein